MFSSIKEFRTWSLLFLLLTAVEGRLYLDPIVDTKLGLIKGVRADDGDYVMFLGVPYGKVDPDNPFGAAQPHPKFEEAYEAFDDSKMCPQKEEFTRKISGALDCLRLNIFVPERASNRKKLPVLVWIHGGMFKFGSGAKYAYGPKYLVRHNVILVTINYRLGPYGFMCLDIPEISGNQGLKDQAMALRWIRDNIEEFGGDPNKVTAYGVSSGSACVEFHIVSRNEKLFDQAILGSSSIYGRWAVGGVDNTVPIKLAKQLGYETDDIHKALSFLKQTDFKLLIEAADKAPITLIGCVEKHLSKDAFLLENPMEMKTAPKARNMSILSGFNSDELLLTYINKPAEFFNNIDPFRRYVNQVGFVGDTANVVYKLLRNFYIGDDPISEHVKWQLDDFNSDVTFIYPIYKSIERYLDSGAKVIYHYLFAYSGERNFAKSRHNITVGGAAHADELGYIFDVTVLVKDVNAADQIMIDKMTTMWTNFVKYGNPTPKRTQLLPVQWPAVTKDTFNYLYIGVDLIPRAKPFFYRLAFWDHFFETYGKFLDKTNEYSHVDSDLV